jgi:3-methyl-2-oxobutanoate hydroxymethyltransferase
MKKNLRTLKQMQIESQKITWLTCYDYSFATILDSTDIDMILVGDSGGMVMSGYENTVPVSMDEMINFSKSVRSGAPNKFIVGDMPKGSYEVNNDDAIRNAMRFVKEAGCDAVKLEGGINMSLRIKSIVDSGIPVIGHIGLTPQSASSLGGYRVVGRNQSELTSLTEDAKAVEQAGAFAVLLEAAPPSVAMAIKKVVDFPVLGIGSGSYVDGQLLILHDLLGIYPNFRPKFAKCYVPAVIEDFIESIKSFSKEENSKIFKNQDGIHALSKLCINKFIYETRNLIFPNDDFSYQE